MDAPLEPVPPLTLPTALPTLFPVDKAVLAARKRLAEVSLHDYVQQAWHIVEPDVDFIDGWHIRFWCKHLEAVYRGEIPKLLGNIPPGCMKSLLTSVFWPTWSWIDWPESRWMFGSYAHTLSTRDSLKRRKIFDSAWYQERWGKRWYFTSDQNQKTRYENSASGWMFSTSVGGAGTGEHPDFIVIDDPHNVTQSESDAQRDDANRWIDGTLGSRGLMRDSRRVLIMQRLHDNDATGHLLEKPQHGWVHVCFPMYYEREHPFAMQETPLGMKDERTEEGELLWPAGMTEARAQEMQKNVGVIQWPGQGQQRPTKAGGQIFKSSTFLYFKTEQLSQGDKRQIDDLLKGLWRDLSFVLVLMDEHGHEKRVFPWQCSWRQYCDTATSESDDAAYTVVTTVAITPENRILVFDVSRERLEIPKQYGFLLAQRARFNWLDYQAVEKASSGIGLIQMGRAQGHPFRVLEALGSKESRASAIATMYENRMVYHLQDAAWLNDFETELMNFPRGKYKDQVDTMSYCGIDVASTAALQPSIRDPKELDEENELPSVDQLMRLANYSPDAGQNGQHE